MDSPLLACNAVFNGLRVKPGGDQAVTRLSAHVVFHDRCPRALQSLVRFDA